jgi:hypothetical protein
MTERVRVRLRQTDRRIGALVLLAVAVFLDVQRTVAERAWRICATAARLNGR